MNILLGISASDGIGIGKAFVVPEAQKRVIPQLHILPGDRKEQLEKFDKSLATVVTQIAMQMDAAKGDKVQSEIFETYFLMLNDPEFLNEVRKSFDSSDYNIEYILNEKTEEYADRLRNSGNAYLSERAQDICDIFGKVLDDMLDFHPFNIECVPDDSVIVATQLNPSDTIILTKKRIQGLALTEGGVSSHVGIIARNFGIPAVFALENVTSEIKTGETVIVDGISGEAIVNPDKATVKDYEKKIQEDKAHKDILEKYRNLPAKTADGTEFSLMANIGTVEEAEIAVQEGADGIGLFRTEFLFMNEANSELAGAHAHLSAFSEESQFNAYKTVLEKMNGKPVTIRTLDAGGDKLINSKEFALKDEKNPLMGLRAIRLSLANPKQLKVQFRALFRAAVYGNLKIMLPLITSVGQVKSALGIAEEAKEELRAEEIPFDENVPIGIMVETAAAAMTADLLAKESAFFSIGTNDLTQYTIGVDRENVDVADLYDEFHPAVVRFLNNTIQEAAKAGIPLSVCGEMAGRKESILLLAGLGVRTLSMSPKMITTVKELLSNLDISSLEKMASEKLM